MGESDRYVDYRPKKGMRLGDDNNALVALFAMNGVLFMLLMLIQVSYGFSDASEADFYWEIVCRFGLPGTFATFITQPWSLLTYMFSDSGQSGLAIIHFASNMIWLWGFGRLFQQIAGNENLIPVYLYGGLLGGIVYMVAYSVLPALPAHSGLMLGANTGVMAVAMAVTATLPQHRFFQQLGGGIPLWVLMAIYLLIDLSGPIRADDTATVIAHLGAALAGLLFILLLRRGTDAGAWMHRVYAWFMNLYKPGYSDKGKIREKIFYESAGRKPFTRKAHITQQRIDEILDKINLKGYEHLSREEREILKRASEEDNLNA